MTTFSCKPNAKQKKKPHANSYGRKTRQHGRHKEKKVHLKERKESKNNQRDTPPMRTHGFHASMARLQLDLLWGRTENELGDQNLHWAITALVAVSGRFCQGFARSPCFHSASFLSNPNCTLLSPICKGVV